MERLGALASVFVRAETPGDDWPQIEAWLDKARQDDTEILASDEVLFVGRVFVGDPPRAIAVGAATASLNPASVVLAGGERAAILPILNAICTWARASGATRIFTAGRKGWDRVSPFRLVASEGRKAFYELEL
jgi:hypothetical protein